MEKKKFKVYVHTNKVNGKRYVGITGRDPEKRWVNGLGYASNYHFNNAIKKYGWGNFEHEILFKFDTVEEALNKETELILEWKTSDPELGYNVIVEGTIGSYTLGQPAVNRRAVRCIELDKIFESVAEAAKFVNVNKAGITACCQGTKMTARKYHWEYVDDELREEFMEAREKILKGENISKYRRVRCVETGEILESTKVLGERYGILSTTANNYTRLRKEFKDGTHWEYLGEVKCHKDSLRNTRDVVVQCVETKKLYRNVSVASKITGANASSIRNVINGRCKVAGGAHWKLVPVNEVNVEDVECGDKIYGMYKRVVCIETGIIYNSVIDAARETNISADNIHDVCQYGHETAGGFHWEYIEGKVNKEYLKKRRIQVLRKGNSRSRKVKCLETGEVIESYKPLVEKYSLPVRKVTSNIYYGNSFPDGTHWKYLGKQIKRGKWIKDKDQVIKCIETGKVYQNAKTLEKVEGFHAGSILNALRGVSKTSYGYHWEFINLKNVNKEEIIGRSGTWRQVKCVETGKIYESAYDAAKEVGLSADTNLRRACRNGKTSGGFHWKYID